MKALSLLTLATLSLTACTSQSVDEASYEHVIPAPRSVTLTHGHLMLRSTDELEERTTVTFDTTLRAESYRMEVSEKGINVTTADAAGAFYAQQTLLTAMSPDESQPSASSPKPIALPCAIIEDAPRFSYRGFMLDVSRHFRSKEFVMKQMRAMARYKLNRLHLHLTDAAGWRLEIEQHPELTRIGAWRTHALWKDWWNHSPRHYSQEGATEAYGGYYTQDDIRELLALAEKLRITVIPEIEMPGHSEEVLACHPELNCWGEPYRNGEFCPGNDACFALINDVLTEVAALFPAPWIHIGGDEAGKEAWRHCPKCQRRMKQLHLKDEEELQAWFISEVEKIAHRLGKQVIGWDEVTTHPINPDVVCMAWQSDRRGIDAAKAGHHVVMSPYQYCYINAYQDNPLTSPEAMGNYIPLQKVYGYEPVPDTLSREASERIDGVQGNLWTEYVPTEELCETMAWPRLLAIAEVGWSEPGRKDWTRFSENVRREQCWLEQQGYHPFDYRHEYGNRREYYDTLRHLAYGAKVQYLLPWSPPYPAAAEQTLTDGLRGGWTYFDGRWQGFIGRGRLDVVIDLGEPKEVRSVTATFMQSPGPEVYYPGRIEVLGSLDGVRYDTLGVELYPASADEPFGFREFGWRGEKHSVRYLRYHADCGEASGYQFADEIVVR